MEHPTDAMRRTIAEQHDEIAALRAENAKLRDGAYAMRQLYEDELKHALGENAKLRELAVLNWEWAHSCCGNNCKMQTDDCGYQIDRECNYEREIWDRMRELGIEVDE